MQEKIDVRQALRVFQRIIDEGERVAGAYQLNGIKASLDQDGYTVTMKDDKITLHIFFHSQYSLICENRKDLEQFNKRLSALDTSEYA